jgi:hypothetical protein
MEADGQDVSPEPLEERRKRLAKLLSRKTKAMRDGIQLSEAITGDGAAIFRRACWMDLDGIVPSASAHDTWVAGQEHGEDEEPELSAHLTRLFSSHAAVSCSDVAGKSPAR